MTDARVWLRQQSDAIVHAQRPIRVLKALNWDPAVHARFFRRKARELPQPTYPPLDFDADAKLLEFREIRKRLRGRNPVEALLRAKCDEFIELVRMLKARGTKRFFGHSVRLYGDPRRRIRDAQADNLAVARLWAARPLRPRDSEPRELDATAALAVIESIVRPVLGDACRYRVRKRLTADAAAGATGIAVRADARFSLRQARALAHHEGLWHVLTSINGYAQPVLTVLGVGLAGFTMSQEGGGVLAEQLSGNMSLERFRELGERTLAVDNAAQGADYIEVFRDLRERFPEERAAQMCERVFRGGLLTGGAPFTRDAVYARGYCRAFSFVRHAMEHARPGLLNAFFAGKMGLDDAPLVEALVEDGLVAAPLRVPTWAADLDVLGGHVLHSLTMQRFDADRVSRYYERIEARHDRAEWEWPPEVDVEVDPGPGAGAGRGVPR